MSGSRPVGQGQDVRSERKGAPVIPSVTRPAVFSGCPLDWRSAFSAGPDLLYSSSSSNSYHYIGSAKLYSMGHGRAGSLLSSSCAARGTVLPPGATPRHATHQPAGNPSGQNSEIGKQRAWACVPGVQIECHSTVQYSTTGVCPECSCP
jgi:hypothetical protein